ncbi:MAG: exopolyphosphatase/guanosine-5'-triphosphate,3'-diphosphate pyrophosphatase [Saprospiraceae bacterium]|jgi:exopolyphosphatase/guanosine-5'-triphosphate,3'-diphosphate pyrophosphatase
MRKRYAVIDLGTNTFHLLIAEKNALGTFNELYRNRFFVKLAENGIQTIGDLPFERGLNAIKAFKKILEEYEVSTFNAFGTAALRTASNGLDFINKLYLETGIKIQLIPGDREADLIYKGVRQAVELSSDQALIMDIGGGSVEFILADQTGVKWAQSFPVGVSVLYNDFHKTDPISTNEKDVLFYHLNKQLSPLLEQLKSCTPSTLIGASGTFDVLESILCKVKVNEVHGLVKVADFYPIYDQLLKTNLQQRFKMPEIPDSRAEMIIVALLLIHFILEKTAIQMISVSAYAMKEGMLLELMEADPQH